MGINSEVPESEQELSESPSEQPPSSQPPASEVPVPFYRRNPVTSIFSVILVLIYLITSVHTHFQKIEPWAFYIGSFYGPAIEVGQWWRFITATLLHDNPMHLFSNVFGILAFGGLIEPILGARRLLLLYTLSFVMGLFLSWLMNPSAITIGASTIDFGLIGAYLTLALLLRFKLDRTLFFKELRGAIMFIVIFTWWNAMESEHINLWAHLGGFFAGVLYVFYIWLQPKQAS